MEQDRVAELERDVRETHAELEQSRDESVRRQQQINDLTVKNEDLTVQVRCLSQHVASIRHLGSAWHSRLASV